MPAADRDRADRLIAAAAADLVRATLRETGPRSICAYAPMAGEPGGAHLLPALAAAVAGARPPAVAGAPPAMAGAPAADLLLPVLLGDRDLDWATCDPLGTRPLGTRPLGAALGEPAGPRLGVDAIRAAALVLVPALGVDQAGVRLGRGGGSYDRALARVPAGVAVVGVLYDGERHDTLPADRHDHPVTAILTPTVLSLTPTGRIPPR